MAGVVSEPGATAIAASLAELTAGWTPVAGVETSALEAAREALAGALLLGSSVQDILASPLATLTPAPSPELIAELTALAEKVENSAAGLLAVVRSDLAADSFNPAGGPQWARGAQVVATYGPFEDAGGVLQWVDTVALADSQEFTFADGTSFAAFPVATGSITSTPASELTLGAGSVWFLASLVESNFPAGAFAGFEIESGTLTCTEPVDLMNGVFQMQAGATLTLTATPTGASTGSAHGTRTPGGVGRDAKFSPPAGVTIAFTQSNATFEDVSDAHAGAYGRRVKLQWGGAQPAPSPDLPGLLLPMTASIAQLRFGQPGRGAHAPGRPSPPTAASALFIPRGAASVTGAGWLLPVAAIDISILPAAAGAGAARLALGAGATIATEADPRRLPVSQWVLEIGQGWLIAIASERGRKSSTVYELWQEAKPSTHRSSIVFGTEPAFMSAFSSDPSGELLLVEGTAVAHLDRPTTAGGERIAFKSDNAVLVLDDRRAPGGMTVFASIEADAVQPISLALQNVLLGTDAPRALVVAGARDAGGLRSAAVSMTFDLRWLLPTLPDPYATTFSTEEIQRQSGRTPGELGTLLATSRWSRKDPVPELRCALLASGSDELRAGVETPAVSFRSAEVGDRNGVTTTELALLDLSTHVDLLGVALAPELGELARGPEEVRAEAVAQSQAGSAWSLSGMSLAFNGGLVATFALPQVSWEPMESTKFPTGPIYCDPASDGPPLLVMAPDAQQLVPLEPVPVLTNNVANVAAGTPFAALFSLPFGLEALIVQPNRPAGSAGQSAEFIAEGGTFTRQEPEFPERVAGGIALTVMPPDPRRRNAGFTGLTVVAPGGGSPNSYGAQVLSSDVASIFDNDFGAGGIDITSASAPRLLDAIKANGVPVRRIDFSGYGASIFSDWDNPAAPPPAIIKVQFETTVGRTAYEVIQAESMLYPYCILVIRTITMQRENAGWVLRTDTGWVAHSNGLMDFTGDQQAAYAGRVNKGPFLGAFNVRNIVDSGTTLTADGFTYSQVTFDADLGLDPELKARRGSFHLHVRGIKGRTALVASQDLVGWVQTAPDHTAPPPDAMATLFAQGGPFQPQISCTVEAGAFGGRRGTRLRASAFSLGTITRAASAGATPAFGVALLGAPRIPHAGGWSMGVRPYTSPAPTALPTNYPVPLVRPASSDDFWYIADVEDLLDLAQPNNYYGLIHSTGTNKVLFESPRIPTSASVTPAPTGPGLQFTKPSPPRAGGAAGNQGSPNLGDLAAVLNSSGLFPNLGAALSLLEGAAEQLNTTGRGFRYVKRYTFDPSQQSVVVDLGSVLKITMQYADTTSPTGPTPAKLVYRVNSAESPSWRLRLGPLSFIVVIPAFGTDPVLTSPAALLRR